MAVAVTGTPTTAQIASGTTLTQNVPSGIGNGPMLIWRVSGILATVPGTPAGWNLATSGTGTSQCIVVFWRIASSEPASYNLTVGGARWTGTMTAYTGVDPGTPFAVVTGGGSSTGTSSISFNAVTTTTPNVLLIPVVGVNISTSGVTNGTLSSSNTTIDAQISSAAGANTNNVGAMSESLKVAAGAFTPAFTCSQTTARTITIASVGLNAVGVASGTGVITLAATGGATAPAAGTATLVLAATGTATIPGSPASGTASLSLSATGGAAAPAAGTATLALAATGTAQVTAAGTAALTLSATGTGGATGAGAATLSLAATGTARATAGGTGALALTAIGGARATAGGTGTLALAATGTAFSGGSAGGTGSLALAATGAGAGSTASTGSVTLTGAAGASGGVTGAGSASLSLSGAGQAPVASIGSLSLVAALELGAMADSVAMLTLSALGTASDVPPRDITLSARAVNGWTARTVPVDSDATSEHYARAIQPRRAKAVT